MKRLESAYKSTGFEKYFCILTFFSRFYNMRHFCLCLFSFTLLKTIWVSLTAFHARRIHLFPSPASSALCPFLYKLRPFLLHRFARGKFRSRRFIYNFLGVDMRGSSTTSVLYNSAITSTSTRSPYFVPYPSKSSLLLDVPRTRAFSVFANCITEPLLPALLYSFPQACFVSTAKR